MPKVKVNDITMNYEQQGTGEPLSSSPILLPITPAMPFRSRTTPSSSIASQ